ncbi:MAG TPA: DUF1549 domain-containing protein, partial [Pirellulaceae bacterium]|nr:DUF1549 domain-containing protein [Pirellulaceae bacterium]
MGGRIGWGCGWLVALAAGSLVAQEAPDPAGLELFERRVRPLLVERCLECHSAATETSGGLRLDTPAALRRGGDSGPAVVPGDPAASLMLRAIAGDEPDLRMPPDTRLEPPLVADVRRWIELGAPDPRPELDSADALAAADRSRATGLPLDRAAEHWAYRPLTTPVPPMVPHAASPFDAFVQRGLAEAGLEPLAAVDRAVLLRRLTHDLHGLAVEPDELQRFLHDSRPDAVPRTVDRLVASPRFAETFARHWMDVSRFAESLTLRGFVLPDAWRTKEFLIEAFDRDLPFDSFVRLQIAGDLAAEARDPLHPLHADLRALIDPGTSLEPFDAPPAVTARRNALAAVGLLALGNTNLEEQDKRQLEMDLIDEQLDVLGKGLLGQTISCARCHDHKFDPIPTADYYALAGILYGVRTIRHANVSERIDLPLPLTAAEATRVAQLDSERNAIAMRLAEPERRADVDPAVARGPIPATSLAGIVVDDDAATAIGDWTVSQYHPDHIGSGYRHDGATGRGGKTLTFEPAELPAGEYELRFAYTPGDNRASNALVIVFSAAGEQEVRVDQRAAGPIDRRWVSLGRFRFESGGQKHVIVSNAGADAHVIADAVQFLPVDDANSVANESQGAGERASTDEPEQAIEAERRSLEQRRKEIDAALAALPKTHGVIEKGEGSDLPIHVRGSVHHLGSVVPRGFLRCVSVAQPAPASTDASGRIELALWLTHPDQPLTHRVWVNRLTHWLLGGGIVRSVDNFGTTGDEPTDGALLDHLVAELRRGETGTKRLVRQLVLTDAYARRSSGDVTEEVTADVGERRGFENDPENRSWWRGERRRATAEALRDSMLQLSGELAGDHRPRPIPAEIKEDYGRAPTEPRRTVLLPVYRNAIPDLLTAFDVADPSVTVGRRNRSTVPPQSLVLLNDPWVRERAAAAARRWLTEAPRDAEG